MYIYCGKSKSFNIDKNTDKVVRKLGSTTEIERRKWDYYTYLPHKFMYVFFITITGLGEFETLEQLEHTIYEYPFFKNRNTKKLEFDGGTEFFLFNKDENIAEEICKVLLLYNVNFELTNGDPFNKRPVRKVLPLPLKYRYNKVKKIMKNITLRPYQETCIKKMEENVKGIINIPTGTGKSIIFTEYIRRNPENNYLILVPSKQLRKQIKKILENTNNIEIINQDKISQTILDSRKGIVVVGTYQYSKKLDLLFDCIIFDECHYTVVVSREKDKDTTYDSLLQNRTPKKFFFTATMKIVNLNIDNDVKYPSMDDEDIYGKLLYEYKLNEAIDDGWLTDYRLFIIETESRNVSLLKYLEQRRGKSIIVYCSSLKRVREACNYVKEKTLYSVSALLENKNDDEILKKFEENKDVYKVIFTCKKLLCGYDNPSVDTVIHYDTSSSSLENIQKNGRALRLYSDKIISDIVYFFDMSEESEANISKLRILLENMKEYDSRLSNRIEKNVKADSNNNNFVNFITWKGGASKNRITIFDRYWREVKMSYEEAKKILASHKFTSKKEYFKFCDVDLRFSKTPEEKFNKFDWIDFLSIDRESYYTLEECRRRIKNLKINTCELSKVCLKLHKSDKKFIYPDLWLDLYNLKNLTVLLQVKNTEVYHISE